MARSSNPAVSSRTIRIADSDGRRWDSQFLIVQSDATPGTFYSSVVAVGSSGFDLVEQIGKDEQIGDNGGGHPWDLAGGCCYCSIIPRSEDEKILITAQRKMADLRAVIMVPC